MWKIFDNTEPLHMDFPTDGGHGKAGALLQPLIATTNCSGINAMALSTVKAFNI